jgi:methylmalonyl-CoA mutase
VQLFDTFSAPSQEQWLAQIRKELKDQYVEGFEIEPGIEAPSFLHPADQSAEVLPLWSEPIDWVMVEEIDGRAAHAHDLIQHALVGGATGLRLYVDTPDQLLGLTHGVFLQMIQLRIAGPAACNPLIFKVLAQVMESQQLQSSQCNIVLESGLGALVQANATAALPFLEAASAMPSVKSLHLEAPVSGTYSESLAALLAQAETILVLNLETGSPTTFDATRLHATITIGKHYFAEIARLRAFYLLWYNLMQRWQQPISPPHISVLFDPLAYTGSEHTNLIRATTMAMAAVAGGAQALTVRAFDQVEEGSAGHEAAFGRRIARNVQHLLKLESGMHELVDVGAGSYFMEELTRRMASVAWAKYVEAK